MVRFETRIDCVIMTFADAASCVMLNLLPVPSYAVMFTLQVRLVICRTEMFASAILFDSVMFISVPRISKVAL